MTRIVTAVHIDKTPQQLFDFVTTPGNWPQWHPASIEVTDTADYSLEVGEQVTESFHVAGRSGQVVWTCIEREAPRRWVIDGQIVGHSLGGTISYTLKEDGNGTLFEREFVYPTPTFYLTLLDRLLIRRRIQRESELAARQLKALLETGSATAALDINSYYFLNEWNLPVGADAVWPVIINGADYPTWWGSVYEKVESLNGLSGDQVGARASVKAHGRLPYSIRFDSEITEVRPSWLLKLKAHGDLEGEGTWRLTSVDDGTRVTFEWIVRADKPILRLLSPFIKPALEANHRWTMQQGEIALQQMLSAL